MLHALNRPLQADYDGPGISPVVSATSSMKAVLSPPSGFTPTKTMVWSPAVTVKFVVWYRP